MQTLSIGTRFPDIEARALDGSTWRIPEELSGLNAVLIFYRGHW